MIRKHLRGYYYKRTGVNYNELGLKIWKDIRKYYPYKRSAIIDSSFIVDQIKYHLDDNIIDWYPSLLKNSLIQKLLYYKSLKRIVPGKFIYGCKDYRKTKAIYSNWKSVEAPGTIKNHKRNKIPHLYFI